MNKLHIVIIGAGKGGTSILKLFHAVDDVKIVSVIDKDRNAPGIKLAKELKIPAGVAWKKLSRDPKLDIIINVTGNKQVQTELEKIKSKNTEIINGNSAQLIWKLIQEYQIMGKYKERFLTTKRELEKFTEESNFIVGKSPQMQEIKELIAKVAPTPTTVLLRGETGTGKEMIARALYKSSHISDKALVTLNCTALTPSLMESELFGYKKGSFTGAERDHVGLLQEADGGTIFLDEIGDMDLELQAKLLRFLQTGEIRPVGSSKIKYVKVRIIAATNRDIESAIQNGKFRKDLFYRFNTFTINLPPLRERTEDIPYLAEHFLKVAEVKLNKHVKNISDSVLRILLQYSWPGNIRELKNVMERAVILCNTNTIMPRHLPLILKKEKHTFDEPLNDKPNKFKLVKEFEKNTIISYIKNANGNISEASRLSGIPRRTFYRWMKKYGLNRTDSFS